MMDTDTFFARLVEGQPGLAERMAEAKPLFESIIDRYVGVGIEDEDFSALETELNRALFPLGFSVEVEYDQIMRWAYVHVTNFGGLDADPQ